MKYNTLEIYENKKFADKKAENQKHIHRKKRLGSSNLYGCIVYIALQNNGYKLPEKNEVQDDPRPMISGNIHHDDIELTVYDAFNNDVSNKSNEYFIPEVYVENKVGDITIETPLDFTYIKSAEGCPPTLKKKIKMQNIEFEGNIPHPKSEFIQVGDYKSASNWSFNNKLSKNKLSMNYKAQFNNNMLSTNQKEFELISTNRENGAKHRMVYDLDMSLWDNIIVPHIELLSEYIDKFEGAKSKIKNWKDLIPIIKHRKALGCLNFEHEKPFTWWSCPFSDNDVIDGYGKKTQKWKGLCLFAMKFLTHSLVMRRFKPKQIFWYERGLWVIREILYDDVVFVDKIYLRATKTMKSETWTYEDLWVKFDEPIDFETTELDSAKKLLTKHGGKIDYDRLITKGNLE